MFFIVFFSEKGVRVQVEYDRVQVKYDRIMQAACMVSG